MRYAPIVIPTLNRREHLQRCLESLANNRGAEKTDLFISVDYPPSKKYRDGYKEVKAYLEDNNFLEQHFKSVNIFFQKENLGPTRNWDFLRNCIVNLYDRYIFTEDDNEFSENFLEYVNQGLEIFENDDRVIAICGCKEYDWKIPDNDNVGMLKLYPGYGIGSWVKKETKIRDVIEKTLLKKENLKKKNLRKLKRKNRVLFNIYILSVLFGETPPVWCDEKLRAIDCTKSIYMHLTDHCVIVPKESKSRTWGNDGSGVNMKKKENLNPEIEYPLDKKDSFVYKINGERIDLAKEFDTKSIVYRIENYELQNKYMKQEHFSCWQNIKADFIYILFMILGLNRGRLLKIKHMIRGCIVHE